jgi:creatinine amidohydrolase
MPLRLIELSSSGLKALSGEKTAFFFPVGILEDHGPHLPLNVDVAEAERLCWMAAERVEKELPGWTGVLMPSLAGGIDGNTTAMSFGMRAHVVRDWLVDSCEELMRHGFRHFVCVSGTLGPKHLTAIEEAGKIVAGRSRWRRLLSPGSSRAYLASASSALISPRNVWDSPFLPQPSEHGGRRDTSVALAIGLKVDPVYSALIPAESPSRSVLVLGIQRWRRQVSGFWGKPSEASAAEGGRALTERVSELFPKLRAAFEGANTNMIFRSWYSVLPPNKSFFKAWLLFVGILVLMLIWTSWSMRML